MKNMWIIILLVLVIGAAGFAWNKSEKAETDTVQISSTSTNEVKSFESTTAKVKFNYPADWSQDVFEDAGGGTVTFANAENIRTAMFSYSTGDPMSGAAALPPISEQEGITETTQLKNGGAPFYVFAHTDVTMYKFVHPVNQYHVTFTLYNFLDQKTKNVILDSVELE